LHKNSPWEARSHKQFHFSLQCWWAGRLVIMTEFETISKGLYY
jgi:hypothetical protein